MARMPTFEEIAADFGRGVRTAEQAIEHPFRRHQTPAQPATMAPERAATQGDTMSFATFEADLGQRAASAEAAVHAAVQNEIGKFRQDIPALAADVKAFAATPLGKLAVQGAEHVAAGLLPAEGLATIESLAAEIYGRVFGLYNPQGAQQPPAQPQQAPAQ